MLKKTAQLSSQLSRALPVFFGTEMWERYGFYIVQSLLALYLSSELHLADAQIYKLVGSFTALTYISPIIGGWIADHCIGQKKAVLTGGILLFLSYLLLAFSLSLNHLILSFSGIAMGTGLLKPNISSLLGRQFPKNSSQRDSAFTIFYLGITTGIILGTTLPTQLQLWFGWRACFLSAAIGMLLAIFIFSMGLKFSKIEDYAVLKNRIIINWAKALGIIFLAYFIFHTVLYYPQFANIFFIFIILIALFLVLKIAFGESGDQRNKTLSLLVLFIISTCFWVFYFEMFMMLTLFITRAVQPLIFGMKFPAPYYVSVESFGMLILGIFLSQLWKKFPTPNLAISTGIKFMLAIMVMLLAYGLILWTAHSHSLSLLSPWPILLAYLLISLAELLLSPIGLSAVTSLAHPKVVSTLMGIFFVSLGVGGFLSGQLAQVAAISAKTQDIIKIKTAYLHGFSIVTSLLGFVLILAIMGCILISYLSRNIKWH